MFHPEGPTLTELARQALCSTERGYDLLAPKFDRTPFRTPDLLLEAVAPYFGAPGSIRSALDLCCGTGAAMRMLRPLCRERVVGVDFSRGMLDEAGRRLGSYAGPLSTGEVALELVRRDVLKLDFEAEFDVATSFGALDHFVRRDQPLLVDNICRALVPGGRFLTVLPCRHPPWTWRFWFVAAFNSAMAVRNTVVRPPFIMYYQIFSLERARRLFAERGFAVTVRDDAFPAWQWLRLFEAEKDPAPAPRINGSSAPRPRPALPGKARRERSARGRSSASPLRAPSRA